MIDLIIENGKIVSHNKVVNSDIAIKNGKIFRIGKLNKVKSKDRIDSNCPHYSECPGCQYLHTPYSNELSFKKNSLERHLLPLLKSLSTKHEIKTHPAPRRLQYRNRVQLHYDLTRKKLGLKSTKLNKIIEIPSCKVLNPKVESELKDLYKEEKWIKFLQKSQFHHRNQGHIEIYNKKPNTVSLAINKPYAHLGFWE